MITLRFTKNAIQKLSPELTANSIPSNKYCDWFIDFIDSGDNSAYLFTNAYSIFSIVIPAKNIKSAKDFISQFKEELKSYFSFKTLDNLFSEYIEPNFSDISFTKTNNRSVLASIKGLKYRAEWDLEERIDLNNQLKRFKLNDSLNKYITKCANTGFDDYITPEQIIDSEKMKETVPEDTPPSAPQTTQSSKPHIPAKEVYQIYAELLDFEPKIWRRFYISSDMTMEKLGFALMNMFNMHGGHLFNFEIDIRPQFEKGLLARKDVTKSQIEQFLSQIPPIMIESYIDPEMDASDDEFFKNNLKQTPPRRYDASTTKIRNILKKDDRCTFVYDFGDNWRFNLVLEDENADTGLSKAELPRVKEGKGLGIIEDCGGTSGLESIVKAFSTKKGADYQEYKNWLETDSFDITNFNMEEINDSFKSFMRYMNRLYNEDREEF